MQPKCSQAGWLHLVVNALKVFFECKRDALAFRPQVVLNATETSLSSHLVDTIRAFVSSRMEASSPEEASTKTKVIRAFRAWLHLEGTQDRHAALLAIMGSVLVFTDHRSGRDKARDAVSQAWMRLKGAEADV